MNNDYIISGIQQVGVGCENFQEAWNWYINAFGMNVRILEDDTVAAKMLPYTGNKPQKRHACIAVNLQGGGGFEIWQYSERKPVPMKDDVEAADLGIFAAKVKTTNAAEFHKYFEQKMVVGMRTAPDKLGSMLGPLTMSPDGKPCFTVRDPWGNYFQVVEDKYVFINQGNYSGGVIGAMVGSSDIDKAIPIYRDILGYDTIVYDRTDNFADMQAFKGGEGRFRRVLLSHSQPREGAFAPLFGNSTIELFQALDRQPKKLFEGRFWGDPGFIQLCFDVTNMRALEKKCNELGFPFTVDSNKDAEHFDMGEASGHFTYIEDPDGTLIELVEAHKLTILKRPHIFIDMLKRDRKKAFPKFFFRLMGMKKVKFDD